MTLSTNRLFELRDRVHRGAQFIKILCTTSGWMTEIFSDPHFTIVYLGYRSQMGENSFFTSLYNKVHDRAHYTPKHLSSTVFFGLDLEPCCVSQAIHYRVMDQFWRQEAEKILAYVTDPRVIGS